MPSTFTTSLKIELIGNGEQPTTWGLTTNNNMGTLIEQAIAGVQPITLTGDTVLTNFNGLSDQARNAVLVFNGSLANAANVVTPAVEKTYIISNRAGANVTIKTATGTGVTVANSTNTLIYCDGAEFYTAIFANDVIGDLSVTGNQTVGGSFTTGGNIVLNNKITSNAGTLTLNSSTGVVDMATNSGAFTPPTGTDAERPGSPDLGMTRWNSTQGILEIWNGVQWQNITGNYAIDYVIVAGGAGSGGSGLAKGGSGAGGYVASSTTVAVGTAYSIIVGSGGSPGSSGTSSNLASITSTAGGASSGSSGTGGTSGNSFGGGAPFVTIDGNQTGGGGGGATQAGGPGSESAGGFGGNGASSTITGTLAYYGGGGAGGGQFGSLPGGLGGGGSANTNGTANTGGGSGGTYGGQTTSGGSGVVIIRYASASQRGTGGTVTSYSESGLTYFVHTFTTSGTFTA